MLYRKNSKNGKELSILGYGCLRFTKKGGVIDQKKAEEEMKTAIENGVNYFDTAYTYHGSEVCLGKFLAKGYRRIWKSVLRNSYRDCRRITLNII